MELSERCIQTLENEGFTSIHEEARASNESFDVVGSAGKIVIFVTEGSLLHNIDSETKTYLPGDCIDLLSNISHDLISGPAGCQYVVGAM